MSVADVGGARYRLLREEHREPPQSSSTNCGQMDANDLKFSRSPYAIESAGSSVTSKVQRSSPQRRSPERAEGAPTPIPEGPGEAEHAGSPPQPSTSPQSEGDAGGAGVNQLGQMLSSSSTGTPLPLTSHVQKPIRIGWRLRLTRSGRISSGIDWSRRMLKRRRDSRRPIALLLVHLGAKATQMWRL